MALLRYPSPAMRQPIVFVTDYGRDDTYAAALTGAALTIDPGATCIEGTHGVRPETCWPARTT